MATNQPKTHPGAESVSLSPPISRLCCRADDMVQAVRSHDGQKQKPVIVIGQETHGHKGNDLESEREYSTYLQFKISFHICFFSVFFLQNSFRDSQAMETL